MEVVTLEIDAGQMMIKNGGQIKKGDKICYSPDKKEFFIAPFSGKVLAIFQDMCNFSLIVKVEG